MIRPEKMIKACDQYEVLAVLIQFHGILSVLMQIFEVECTTTVKKMFILMLPASFLA